jgi:hypothetical protein
MNASLLIEWFLFLSFIVFLIYLAIVIGSEKSTYIDEAKFINFKDLTIPIPKWWTTTLREENKLRFERTDTRYDWYSEFIYVENDLRSSAEILVEHLQKQEIKMDPQPDAILSEVSEYLIKDKEAADRLSDFSRIEGMGTQGGQERLYYDLIICKREDENGYYQFLSHSSVLNGSVEGPYFEEALSLLKLKDS